MTNARILGLACLVGTLLSPVVSPAEDHRDWEERFHRAHDLLKQAQQLEEEGNEAGALEHRAGAERLIAQMAQRTEQTHRARREEGRRHIEELHQRAGRMGEDIEALIKAGRHDQAEKVERERAELEAHIHKLAQRRESRDREERLHRLAAEIDELREAGHHEEAQRLRAESLEEPMRRLHHLRVAAENLHAADLPELAERVERHAHELERRIEQQRRRRMAPYLGQLQETIERLNEEVRQLHRATEHLHERLEQLSQDED